MCINMSMPQSVPIVAEIRMNQTSNYIAGYLKNTMNRMRRMHINAQKRAGQ
jgi:ribosomal protein S17E